MYIGKRVRNLTLTLSMSIWFPFSTTSNIFMSADNVGFRDDISCALALIVAWITTSASLYGFYPNKLVGITPRSIPWHHPLTSTPNTLARASFLARKSLDVTCTCASWIFCWHCDVIEESHFNKHFEHVKWNSTQY